MLGQWLSLHRGFQDDRYSYNFIFLGLYIILNRENGDMIIDTCLEQQ